MGASRWRHGAAGCGNTLSSLKARGSRLQARAKRSTGKRPFPRAFSLAPPANTEAFRTLFERALVAALIAVTAAATMGVAEEVSGGSSAPESARHPDSAVPVELVIFGFEGSTQGWEVPEWAQSSADYVGEQWTTSQARANEGRYALEIQADFPGGRWSGVYVEHEVEVTDWTPFGQLSVDVYLPPEAPSGLQGKIILTVGEQWTWTEMNRTIPLAPGQWTTIAADLKPRSFDWNFFPDGSFRTLIRKLGVRVESDREPAYRGPIFIDNVRLTEYQQPKS